jgi:epoxyqueuosine reductase
MPNSHHNITNQIEHSTRIKTDQEAGFEILDTFQRFHQKNEMFRRSQWDKRIRNAKSESFYANHSQPPSNWRNKDGFSQIDYSLRNAAWHIRDLLADAHAAEGRREGFSDIFILQGDVACHKADIGTPNQAAD